MLNIKFMTVVLLGRVQWTSMPSLQEPEKTQHLKPATGGQSLLKDFITTCIPLTRPMPLFCSGNKKIEQVYIPLGNTPCTADYGSQKEGRRALK